MAGRFGSLTAWIVTATLTVVTVGLTAALGWRPRIATTWFSIVL